MDENDVLFHYGVKGMKWGVRKKRKSSSISKKVKSAIRKAKKKETAKKEEDEKKEKSTTKVEPKKKASDFSDEDLKQAVYRMTMEKQYRTLMKELEPKKKTPADVLKSVSKVGMKGLDIFDAVGGAKALGKKYDLTDAQTEQLETSLKVLKVLMK